jgi:YidC/Oxa1 family membrane protein insertase
MLRLDTDIMATTVPDLQNYHIKRSTAREDIEYIYIPHGVVSSIMLVREKAYDYYDTFFCNGPGIVTELRRREETAGLKKRAL